MRALCGAIIAAGGLIGLGLTALGIGIRYQALGKVPDSDHLYGSVPLMLILVVMMVGVVVGLGVAFLGLAYHHERRHREMLHEMKMHGQALAT